MPLTPFDVTNLERSISGVGESFADNREEKRRQRSLDIADEHERNMEQASMQRYQEALRQHTRDFLADMYKTTGDFVSKGMDPNVATQIVKRIAQNMAQQNPDEFKNDPLTQFIASDDFKYNNPKDENVSNDPIHQDIELPGGRKGTIVWRPRGNEFRVIEPEKKPEEDLETVTEEYPAQEAKPGIPGTPASSGFLGIGGKAAVPAVPGTPAVPARKVSYKLPRGTTANSFTPPTTNAPALSGKPSPANGGATIPQAHINYLKANPKPEVIADFEAKYGVGSAKQFLPQ